MQLALKLNKYIYTVITKMKNEIKYIIINFLLFPFFKQHINISKGSTIKLKPKTIIK